MRVSSFISQLRPGWFHLTVHAKPGARSSSLACHPAVTDAALEVRISAPPVEGKANAELVDFMQMLLEQELARVRAAQQHTPVESNGAFMNRVYDGHSKKDKKKNKPNTKMECPVNYPDKVRVSLVGGASARHKTLEVAFPGTEEELISVLQSAYVS
ncbi:putative ACR, YggU family COG1872 [Trypanosoma cruzi]|nr:putative ACR, YggU family COG1872 [Trypanosoma cruzi]